MAASSILWRGRAIEGRGRSAQRAVQPVMTAERERIEDFLACCAEAVAESAEVLHLAQALQQLSLPVHDALHLSSAAVGGADYFLTCDDRLVNRAREIQGLVAQHGIPITVMNPCAFLGLIHPTGGGGA
jgi:predicted nucleic acid-binding protein